MGKDKDILSSKTGSGHVATASGDFGSGGESRKQLANGTVVARKKPANIGDFTLLHWLGSEGESFKRLRLARHRRTGKYYIFKCFRKTEVVNQGHTQHVVTERKLLNAINLPYIVRLQTSVQDNNNLYLVFEAVTGGSVAHHISTSRTKRLSVDAARIIAGEIAFTFGFLHEWDLCYRNLNSDSVYLDGGGHIKLMDFTYIKRVPRIKKLIGREKFGRTYSVVGSPIYMAPEVVHASVGHWKECDWWSLGVLLYEMLTGYPPFYDVSQYGIYQKILEDDVHFPPDFDPAARDLVTKLLEKNRDKRLGSTLIGGPAKVMSHPFFRSLDFENILLKQGGPALNLNLDGPDDLQYLPDMDGPGWPDTTEASVGDVFAGW